MMDFLYVIDDILTPTECMEYMELFNDRSTNKIKIYLFYLK